MAGWQPEIVLDQTGEAPLFLQISQAMAAEIRSGRFAPGAELPSSRALATALRVHRNTVLAAYRELEAEGWIHARPKAGTFVTEDLPPVVDAPRMSEAVIGFAIPPGVGRPIPKLPNRGVLNLSGGSPDPRLFPIEALSRAYRRALRISGREVLSYGDPRGHKGLRRDLATMLSSLRGLAATSDRILVTRGCQMALDLIARTLLRPGDRVAIEALGYRPAWGALSLAGAELVPIPVDEHGMDVAELERLAERGPFRAVYVTPHHQYPTLATLSPGRRMRLLELARRKRMIVLEDDYDHEFHLEGRPVLPLASADTAGVVVYLGTLSKILMPGLRIGFVCGPEPLIKRLAEVRLLCDRQGDLAVETAVASLLADGEVQRHARRVRRVYQSRREALIDSINRYLKDVVTFRAPSGGLALWVRSVPDIDVEAWLERSAEQGVVFQAGSSFTFDGSRIPFARFGFSALTEAELCTAVERLARILP